MCGNVGRPSPVTRKSNDSDDSACGSVTKVRGRNGRGFIALRLRSPAAGAQYTAEAAQSSQPDRGRQLEGHTEPVGGMLRRRRPVRRPPEPLQGQVQTAGVEAVGELSLGRTDARRESAAIGTGNGLAI